jgi:hypothetical protein
VDFVEILEVALVCNLHLRLYYIVTLPCAETSDGRQELREVGEVGAVSIARDFPCLRNCTWYNLKLDHEITESMVLDA